MSTLDEMEMPTLTFDPAPEPEEKAPVVPVQEEKAKLEKNGNEPAAENSEDRGYAAAVENNAEYDNKNQPEEEPMGHEWLERFLDADRLEDRLAVLKQMEGHVTQRELDCIFLSLDLQPETGKTKTEQISALRRHIQLLRRYDGGRLR